MSDIRWKCDNCGAITVHSAPRGCSECGNMMIYRVSNLTDKKRDDYIDWHTYFMGVAMLASRRSKDPSTQVGACIVNKDNIIVGIGYNGMPRGCSDDSMPWARSADNALHTKYPFVCHAELNAILNANTASLKGCTLYATLFPCNECAKAIIQSGISKVIYYEDKYADTDSVKASKIMFDASGVSFEQYTHTSTVTLPL